MELDLLEAKKYLSRQGYGSGTNYTTNLVAVLLANYAQEKVKKLQQHSVMQAEGSEVSEGATVGQRSVGTNAVRWECKVCGKSFDENYELYDHYDTEHNKGGGSPLRGICDWCVAQLCITAKRYTKVGIMMRNPPLTSKAN